MDREELLIYYKKLYEGRNSHIHTRKLWNEKAESWVSDNADKGSMEILTRKRIENSIRILKGRGLLTPNVKMIDLGCGPGDFALAFSPYVESVLGMDISDAMIMAAKEKCRIKGIMNVSFIREDFKDMDLGNPEASYDMVFAFISPAMGTLDLLKKSMRLSHAYCMNSVALSSESRFDEEIMKALLPVKGISRFDENRYFSLINLLWLLGYDPMTEIYEADYEENFMVTDEKIRRHMDKLKYEAPYTEADFGRVKAHILSLCHEGIFDESVKARFGAVLWDVRRKRERKGL